MPLTPEDVQNKRFSTVRFKEGYDEEEVDAFLDEVEAELRRLLAENESLSRKPAPAAPAATAPTPAAPPPPAPPSEEPSEAALRTLLLAQRTADEAVAQAKAEAEQILTEARTKAGTMEAEARQQHAAAVGDLQRQRSALEAQIDELRGFEREYRTRLKAYLEGQLRELETRGVAAPPAAAGRPTTPGPGGSMPGAPSPGGPAAPTAAAPAAGSSDVPRLAPPSSSPAAPSPAAPSPFAQAPRLVEDVDPGSDAPSGPPHEPGDETSEADPGSERP